MNAKTKRRLKELFIPLGILFGLCLIFFLFVYFALFLPNFTRKEVLKERKVNKYFTEELIQKNKDDSQWFITQNYQEIEIQSFDGLKLVAYNLPAENAKGTWILIHGHQSAPLREYASLARFFHENGYNVVLPYQRAHGKSEGKYITFGINERYDLRDWILKVNQLYGDESPLYIEGISMGSATVLMTLGFDLPVNIKSVVADCGYTSPEEIIWKVLRKDKNLPLPRLIMIIGNMLCKILADFEWNDYSTLTALRYNQRPILFIHGTADDYVPVEMTIANYQYCRSEKFLYLVENCPHAIANLVDEEKYHENLIDFCGL